MFAKLSLAVIKSFPKLSFGTRKRKIKGFYYISSTGKYGSHIGFPGARDVIAAQALGPGDE